MLAQAISILVPPVPCLIAPKLPVACAFRHCEASSVCARDAVRVRCRGSTRVSRATVAAKVLTNPLHVCPALLANNRRNFVRPVAYLRVG